MSFLFTLDESKLTEQLPEIFDAIELEIKKAEPLCEIEGVRLELLARDLPKHQGHYDLKAQEMKQLMKWLENYKAKQEAILLKNYSKGQRALSATDQRILISAATELYGKLDAIVEAFKQMGWMIGHITKLRVAELGDIII